MVVTVMIILWYSGNDDGDGNDSDDDCSNQRGEQ